MGLSCVYSLYSVYSVYGVYSLYSLVYTQNSLNSKAKLTGVNFGLCINVTHLD